MPATIGSQLHRRWLLLLLLVLAAAAALTLLSAVLSGGLSRATAATTCTDSWKTAASGSWSDPTQWSTGAVPGSSDVVCITPNGTYTVTNAGTTSVKSVTVGGTSGVATLDLDNNCSVNTDFTTTAGMTITAHGAVTMTSSSCGNRTSIAGKVTNGGTLTMDGAIGGTRQLHGNLTNNGTFAINTSSGSMDSGAALTNNKTVTIGSGDELSLTGTGTTFTNAAAGNIAASGSGVVYMNGGTVFNEAGKATGTGPVEVDGATLNYIGSGASTIFVRNAVALSGNVSAGQVLNIQNDCSAQTDVTAGASWSNAGTINLQSASCGNRSTLTTSSGTLTNSGTIHAVVTNGGTRQLSGNLTNASGGNVSDDAGQTLGYVSGTFVNNGNVSLSGDSAQLSVTGTGTTFTNGSSGTIAASGSGVVYMNGGTVFNEAGKATGTGPVEVDGATLNYTGSGASTIFVRNAVALSGNVSAGQVLNIQNDCSAQTDVTAGASWSNAGTINLQSASCGNRSTLTTSSGTLTNSGTIHALASNAGARALHGNLTNTSTGSVTVDAAQELTYDTGTFVNNGTVSPAGDGAEVSVSSATFTNGASGTIAATGSGVVYMNGGTTFNEAGKATGTGPVEVDGATLNYTGTGASTIFARNTVPLTGNIGAGQVLNIQNDCSANTAVTAGASWSNAGTINLQSASCGNNSTLTTSSGTLTNAATGQINSLSPNGGTRDLAGNLKNSGTITVNQSLVDGAGSATFTMAGGKLTIANGQSFTINGGGTTVDDNGGTIAGNASGFLSLFSGTWNQGAGHSTGTQPIYLDNTALNYVGSGGTVITAHGVNSTISGDITGTTQRLIIENTCSENTTVTASASFTNDGTIQLQSAGCGNTSLLSMPGLLLTNNGTLTSATGGAGGTARVDGSVSSAGTVGTAAGRDLNITGNYNSTGTFKPGVDTTPGHLVVNGSSSIAGSTLAISRTSTYRPTNGTSVNVLTAASVSGTFAHETGAVITGPRYFIPQVTSTQVNLLVQTASVGETPASGLPGSSVKLTGASWPANDQLTITFTGHNGTVTTYPTVTATAAGKFSVTEAVPSGASDGAGKFTVISSYASGLTASKAFTVLATLSETPTSGPPGTHVTLSGTGWPASDTLTITFTANNGTVHTYPTVMTDSSGAFSTVKVVPTGAATGAGTFSVTSAASGLTMTKTFTVT